MSALLATLALAVGAPQMVEAHAVIVAHNQSFDGALRPLRYADDDGARYHELLSLSSRHVELLSVLDAGSQGVFPAAAAAARSPTRSELQGSLRRTFAAIEAANARGVRTVFYFVYVGHGSVGKDGEGYMHLTDSRFSRADLFQEVIAKSPAAINHVLIDACNAYLMVSRRGEGDDPDLGAALDDFLGREVLDRYPNTGVIVSTSSAQDVHEWSGFEAGVFSHELRSAMAGAADVDLDGRVSYAEADAFIEAANLQVKDPKAKLRVHARAPRLNLAEPLFDRARTRGAPTLRIPGRIAGRYYLEDARGVRVADFNASPGHEVTLVLVPQPTYFLRTREQEIPISLDTLRTVDATEVPARQVTVGPRGAAALTFQHDLFAVPFGRAFFDGYRVAQRSTELRLESPAPRGPRTTQVLALGSAGLSVVSFALAVGFGVAANAKAGEYRDAIGPPDVTDPIRASSESHARRSNVFIGVGAGLAVSAAALWLWSEVSP